MEIYMIENELMLSQIEIFEKETEHTLEVKDGRPYYKGNLFCISDYLPDNLVIDGNLNCYVGSTKLPKGLKVNGDLDISNSGITEIPDDCKFNSLNISHTKVAKLRDNLVLEYLSAYNSELTELPKGLKVKYSLVIGNTNITEIPDDCEFGSLNISSTSITKLRDNLVLNDLRADNSSLIELPKNLKVKDDLDISYTDITEIPDDCECGSLYMAHTKITKLRDDLELQTFYAESSSLKWLPNGLKVKGNLNIKYTNITEFPDDCECGSLDMSYTNIKNLPDNLVLTNLIADDSSLLELPKNLVVFQQVAIHFTKIKTIPTDCFVKYIHCGFNVNDDRYTNSYCANYQLKKDTIHINHPSGREFLHVDGLLSEVIEKKGNVYHVRNGINLPMAYVVTDGNEHWAHGYTLDDANQDLHYKMSLRDKTEYEKLTLESELTFDEAVACYRVITGACSIGTMIYIENRLPKPRKEKYSIREMIDLTKDEYGGDAFQEFFEIL